MSTCQRINAWLKQHYPKARPYVKGASKFFNLAGAILAWVGIGTTAAFPLVGWIPVAVGAGCIVFAWTLDAVDGWLGPDVEAKLEEQVDEQGRLQAQLEEQAKQLTWQEQQITQQAHQLALLQQQMAHLQQQLAQQAK